MRRTTLCSISTIFSSMVEVLVIMTDITSHDDGEESDLNWACEISSFGFPLMGEKPCDQLLVKEEGDLPPYLRCFKVEMSSLMTLFLVRGSKEMIVWTLASLVDWAWSWLFALGWLRLFALMQLLVVVVPSLVEVAIVEAWMFLLEAIKVSSKMMKISFFKGEWDERQRCPTGRAKICGRLNLSVRNKSNK